MKYTTRMIGIVVAFCMAIPVFAQQYKATIPYRMVGEKMIIEMKVNGTARPFILIREDVQHSRPKPARHCNWQPPTRLK